MPDGPTLVAPEPGCTLAEQLFATLSEAILQGELAPGAKISEPALARRYGVSRGPLREALHRLQERRLITRSANQGARVAQLSAQGLAEIFVVREGLEGIAAREAALHATPEERHALQAAVARHHTELSGAATSADQTAAASRDFHFLIAKASRNPLLIQLLCHELYPLLRLYRGTVDETQERIWRAFEEHRRILHAIEDRDPELAELLMRRHVAAAKLRREKVLLPEQAASRRNGPRRT